MCDNRFNFINAIITCLLHYRSKQAKDAFNKRIKMVQNPAVSDKEDLLVDREGADEFFSKCIPFTPEALMTTKLCLKSEDELLAKRVFDTSRYITMTYDMGKMLRKEYKIGFRQSEIDYIKKKVEQVRKWVFSIAEFNVVIAYRTIDEQGFTIIAEVMDGDNKFDKAMRIVQVIYERFGINVGKQYVGLLPDIRTALSSEVCPFSFDDKYLVGYVDENNKYFGSFDAKKILGNADEILDKNEIEKRADFNEVEFTFPYASEMQWFEEKKYNVLHTSGLNITIKGGIKKEEDWVLPKRQLTFTDEGIKIIYNDAKIDNNNKKWQISEAQTQALVNECGDDGHIFTVINKEGEYEPCNIGKLKELIILYKNKGMIDIPLMCLGGYKKLETDTFIQSKLILFQFKKVQDLKKVAEFLMKNAKYKILFAFESQENPGDLCIVIENNGRLKYKTYWEKLLPDFEALSLEVVAHTGEEDHLLSIPNEDTVIWND